MWAPPVINRIPPGLLRVFGVNDTGEFPRELVKAVAPVIDVWDLYATQSRQYITGAGTAGAVDGTYAPVTDIAIPDQEWWYIDDFNVDVQTFAAMTLNVHAFWQVFRGTSTGQAHYPTETATLTQNAVWLLRGPRAVIVPPGSKIRINVTNKAGAGNFGWSYRCSYTPLGI